MRIRHIATFAETIRTDPVTLAREYLSARDAAVHEFTTDEARADYVAFLLALGRFQHRTAFATALAQLDTAPAAEEANAQRQRSLRPIAWRFDAGTTFPGYTDDSDWNGFVNVWVGAETWPYVLAELIAGADGDDALIAHYRSMGEIDGLIALSHRFTTTEVVAKWPRFFDDYPIATMVPIPESWTEESWQHETAPSFSPCAGPMGELAQLWIDYEQPGKREFPEAGRFTFCRRDAIGELTVIYAGDYYDDLLRHVAIEQLACSFAHRLATLLNPAEWRDMRLSNRTVEAGVCASHDVLDANMVMLNTWRAIRDPACLGNGEAEDLCRDSDHVNAAWTIATRCYLTACAEGARFDDWRMTGRDVPSLVAEGHDLARIPPSDSAGRVYAPGFMEADGEGWVVNVATSSRRLDNLIDADAHLWSLFASEESRHALKRVSNRPHHDPRNLAHVPCPPFPVVTGGL